MRIYKGHAGTLYTTSFNDDGAEFEWSIGDFFSLSHDDGDYYNKIVPGIDGKNWWLEIYPNGDSGRDSHGYVDIVLCRKIFWEPVSVNMSVSLITVNREKSNEQHATKVFEAIPNYFHTFNRIIPRLELKERQAELTPSGTLTVAFTLKWSAPTRSENSAECSYCKGTFKADCISSHQKKCMQRTIKCPDCFEVLVLQKWLDEHECGKENAEGIKKLVEDFKQVLFDTEFSDVVLKVGDREFDVHKVILAARSCVFASMFKHDLAEKNTNEVEIPDCTAESFEVFLHYIYCGSIDNLLDSNVCNLYYAADKYQVDDLKKLCVKFMTKNLSVETFCDVIVLSLQHGESELQTTAIGFFSENIKKILKTVQWQQFMIENPTYANELLIKAHDA